MAMSNGLIYLPINKETNKEKKTHEAFFLVINNNIPQDVGISNFYF